MTSAVEFPVGTSSDEGSLLAWVMRKFKRFRAHKVRAGRFLERLARENAGLFVHWRLGMTGVFS
jgi:RNA-directed DNA polymerase